MMRFLIRPRPHNAGRRLIPKIWFIARVVVEFLLVIALFLSITIASQEIASNQMGVAQAQGVIVPSITYDSASNTVEVRNEGAVVDLTDIWNALQDPSFLEQVGNAEWLLKVNLATDKGVRLELHGTSVGGDVDWLKLLSEPASFVSVQSTDGQISIAGARITSWDQSAGSYDTRYLDGSGRAYISIKNNSTSYTGNRMDIADSELAYLGYYGGASYGVSLRVSFEPRTVNTGILGRGLTGTISGSKFHDNYFGLYTWGTGDMTVQNNEFYNNYRYGFDGHTETQRTLVEGNYSHDNGDHGIIFADNCTGNTIRNNTSANNTGHGIMLYQASDNNVVTGNTVTGNDDGIAIFESSNSTMTNNLIRNNTTGIRVYGREFPSSSNVFQNNTVSGSKTYGIYMYDAAVNNAVRGNQITGSAGAGIYAKSVQSNVIVDNKISNNEDGIQLDNAGVSVQSRDNRISGNTISDNGKYGYESYAPQNANLFENNVLSGNALGGINYSGQSSSAVTGASFGGTLRIIIFSVIVLVSVVTVLSVLFNRRRGKTRG